MFSDKKSVKKDEKFYVKKDTVRLQELENLKCAKNKKEGKKEGKEKEDEKEEEDDDEKGGEGGDLANATSCSEEYIKTEMNLSQDILSFRMKSLKKAHKFFLKNMDFNKEDFTKYIDYINMNRSMAGLEGKIGDPSAIKKEFGSGDLNNVKRKDLEQRLKLIKKNKTKERIF
jgi:hypothetical protein